MATPERCAPQREPVGVDTGMGAEKAERRSQVVELGVGEHMASGNAVAGTQVTKVEQENGKPFRGEALGEGLQPHLLHAREPGRHDDGGLIAWLPLGLVEPAAAGEPATQELDICPHVVSFKDALLLRSAMSVMKSDSNRLVVCGSSSIGVCPTSGNNSMRTSGMTRYSSVAEADR